MYARAGEVVELRQIDDPDAVDALIELFLVILGASGAPTAAEEIEVLAGRSTALELFTAGDSDELPEVDALAEYLQAGQSDGAPDALAPDASQSLRRAIIEASGEPVDSPEALTPEPRNARDIADRAFRSEFAIGRMLRWFALFKKYRYVLVDTLAEMYADGNRSPVLLAPALVDYSRWLRERVASPFRDQIRVMGMISARDREPAVHGYAPFDPLHEVYFRKDSVSDGEGEHEPALELVAEAIDDHGFLGAKLYPPMGFRPSGNADVSVFPQHVIDDIGPTIGADLDNALDDLYTLIESRGACIIAHGANSNAAGENFGERADPAYWLPVFRRHPHLKVCVAHFGGFDERSATPVGPTRPEYSWEWTLGAHLQAYRREHGREAPVYADLSYYAEILNGDAAQRARYAGYLKSFVERFDPECRHLLFGSDWMMLGLERGHERYAEVIGGFLAEDCGLDTRQLNRVMYLNACRFMGLFAGDSTRERLERFYVQHNLDTARLPGFEDA
jgi:predicted TIM-barrel fold metal-dependent hydrolase